MNQFTGRSNNIEAQKFSRDDEQILALNYENVCDSEYLNRLFIIDNTVITTTTTTIPISGHNIDSSNIIPASNPLAGIDINGQSNTNGIQDNSSQQQNNIRNHQTLNLSDQNETTLNDCCMISPALPEDIILFGEAPLLGRDFLNQRFYRLELSKLPKYQDPLSTMICRQVLIFDHIGKLMIDRCKSNIVKINTGIKSIETENNNTNEKINSSHFQNMVPEALLSILISIEKQSRTYITQSEIEPILALLVSAMQRKSTNYTNSLLSMTLGLEDKNKLSNELMNNNMPLSSMQLQYLRMILCNAMMQGITTAARSNPLCEVKNIEENIKLTLCCAYGLLSIGMYSQSTEDLLVAFSNLMCINLLLDEFLEKLAYLEKGQYTIDRIQTDQMTDINNLSEKMRLKAKLTESGKVLKISQTPSPGGGAYNPINNNLGVINSPVGSIDFRSIVDGKETQDSLGKVMSIKNWDKSSGKLGEKESKSKYSKTKSLFDDDDKNLLEKNIILNNTIPISMNTTTTVMHVSTSIKNSNNDEDIAKNQSNNHLEEQSPLRNLVTPSPKRTRDKDGNRDLKSTILNLAKVPKNILRKFYESRIQNNKNGHYAGTLFNDKINITQSYVWSCGQNSYGELGHEDVNQRRSFSKVAFLEDKCVISIGAGNEHSVFVTKDGKLFVSGYNDNGQCGTGSNQQVRQISQVQALEGEYISQVHVYNGCEHTLAITKDGKLFSFGYNYRGQLGLGNTSSEALPRPVKGLLSRKVIMAACSYHHSMMLCADGVLFSCGRNDCGQLGHGDTTDKKTPQPVLNHPKEITSLSCGQYHTLISTTDGVAYVCGKNDYGQLGYESTDSIKTFSKLLGSPEMDSVMQVCCGYYHTLILCHNGLVFGFGRNDYGQLGLGHTQPRVYNCQQISHLRDKNVLHVTAGCYHSIASTLNGMLYVFGRNNHGQLGTGDLDEKHSPHPVDNFVGRRILSVAAGFYHTLVLTVDDIIDSIDDETDVINNKRIVQIQTSGSESSVENAINNELSIDVPLSKTLPPPLLLSAESKASKISRSHSLSGKIINDKDQNFEQPTRVSVREILIQIVNQLDDTVKRNQVPRTCSDKEISDRWVCRIIGTIGTLFELIRTFICDAEGYVEIPFSLDESFGLLRTLFRVTEVLLKQYRQELNMGDDNEDSAVEEEFKKNILLVPTLRLLTASDIILEIHAAGNSNSTGNLKTIKRQILGKLRQELLFIYLLVPDIIESNTNLVTNSLIEDCSKCLTKSFTILYYNASLRANFFCTLGAHLIALDSSRLDELITVLFSADNMTETRVETVRILRLYTRVSFKYRGNIEVVNLFQTSKKQGLLIFRSLLKVYSHLSLICLNVRVRQSTSITLGEFSRAMGMLEHCNSNFIKCAIPIIFGDSQESFYDIGLSIVSEIFHGAELAFNLISQYPLTTDVLNILRSGTVIPSILPTFLLYSIASADKSPVCRDNVLPFAMSLIEKIKIIGQLENTSISSTEKTQIDNQPSNEHHTLKNQASWWAKLSKLLVILCSKLASALILESEKSSFDNSDKVIRNLAIQPIWKYVSGPNHTTNTIIIDDTSVNALCTEMREKFKTTSYQFTQQVAKSSGYINIIENIENLILASYLNNDKSIFIIGQRFFPSVKDNPYYRKIWSHVSSFIMHINSKKSEILSTSQVSWKDFLAVLLASVSKCHQVLTCSKSYVDVNFNIPTPRNVKSKAMQSFRRVILIVVSLNRWKKHLIGNRLTSFANDVVGFYSTVFDTVQNKFIENNNSMEKTTSDVINVISSHLSFGNSFAQSFLRALNVFNLLLDGTDVSSTKVDVLSSIFKTMSKADKNKLAYGWVMSDFCCNFESRLHIIKGVRVTISKVVNLISSFIVYSQSKSYNPTVSELNLLALSVKFIHLLCLQHYKDIASFIDVKSLIALFTLLDEKPGDSVIDEKSDNTNSQPESSYLSKKPNLREKKKSGRRALNSIISLIQQLSLSEALGHIKSPTYAMQLLEVNSDLMMNIQHSRVALALRNTLDIDGFGKINSIDGKESSGGVNLNTLGSGSGKTLKDVKRRCQELITKPIEFRSQEGFVVQGDKLLNNYKGIDFTLVTWIYLTKRSTSTTHSNSFITGKISHNDAWPLVSIRKDGKLEIIYGHGNEFERLTSTASIGLCSWTHLAIVVEPKKIKIFINGLIDSQIVTKGNARAVLYPIVVGSCPQGVRTRVDHVRDGFDGLLSLFRYYTRALSPIHIRVIFDQGPPESYDIHEKWMYQLMSSTSCLIQKFHNSSLHQQKIIEKISSTMFSVFGKDNNPSLRCSALKILEKILISESVKDIEISSHNTIASTSGKSAIGTSIMTCILFDNYKSFEEKLICYFIRLLGACWMPSLIVAAEDASGENTTGNEMAFDQVFSDFLTFLPSLLSEKVTRPTSPPFSLSTNANTNIDHPNLREEFTGELCYHVISLLRNLTNITLWKEAISGVICRTLNNYRTEISQRNEIPQLLLMEMFGAIVLLGETSSGAYIGTSVSTYHSNSVGCVLNINKSSSNATVLSLNDAGNSRQLSVVRLMDLNCISMTSRPVLTSEVMLCLVEVMDTLGPFIKLLMSDLLCIHRPDHPFPRLFLLRQLCPIEVFFFYQILRFFSIVEDRCEEVVESMKLIRSKSELMSLFHLAAVRTLRIKNSSEDPIIVKSISKFWVKSARYLVTLKGKATQFQSFSQEVEKYLLDYVTKYLGIAVESFQGSSHEQLVKQGLLSELIFSVAGSNTNSQSDVAQSFLSRLHVESSVNDTSLSTITSVHTDADAICALRLVYHIRKGIITASRQLFKNINFVDGTAFMNFPLSWRILLWQSILDSNQLELDQDINEEDFNLTRSLYNENRNQVTHAIASSIRYAAISLLQTSSCKIAGNILESTDVFHRLLQAAHTWIDFHEVEGGETDLCFQFLKMLLPSLSFVESCDVELQMMQLCRRSLQILCCKLLKDHEPSKECLSMARSNNFILLRARAQEQLSRQKGNALFQFTPLAHNLTQLTAGLEIIQRCAMYTLGVSNSIMVGAEPPKTPPPKIVGVRSTSIDADLSSCVAILLKEDENNPNDISSRSDSLVVEVAIGIAADGTDCLFETVYYGTSLRFVQSGLSPGCFYQMKCRCFVAGVPLEWSTIVEFHTEVGILFTFDALKCGPDILLSDDGLTASYAGDDSWSTLLGTQPFSSGVTSWEIRIAQSSTAYVFVGVAAGTADLNTFLGGCSNGWGFIGEQALYHNREKVKVYGESFSAGDVIGVILDLNQGTLSFLRNGKLLGTAFDKIYGELFPAVAFYNVGQELEILMDSFNTTCPHERIPCSPSRLNTDEISILTEMIYCINSGAPMSTRILGLIVDQCNQWCSGMWIRRKVISGKSTFICKKSPLLQKYGLTVGARVRTPYGIAEVTGSAHDRVWFKMSENSVGFWFFSPQQIEAGHEKGYFIRCSYDNENEELESSELQEEDWSQHVANSSFDVASLRELLDSDGWSDEMDAILLKFLLKRAKILNVSPWNVPADYVYEDFRLLQQHLSRIVIANSILLRKWGISGPKRRAVTARLGLLRMFNHMLDNYVPVMMLDVPFDNGSPLQERRPRDEFYPTIITIPHEISNNLDTGLTSYSSQETVSRRRYKRRDSNQIDYEKIVKIGDKSLEFDNPKSVINNLNPFVSNDISLSWESTKRLSFTSTGLLSTSRHRIFSELKLSHFFELINRTSTRPAKTEDDYDYPDDLPQIRINRLKSYRAREASELMGIPGEDLIMSSMFYQLWNELKHQSSHKLRLSYTHPMDDGQSRAFKIRFDGEGVDDYGGPYRESFQKICEELQLPDPTIKGIQKRPWSPDATSDDETKLKAGKCFLPLLHPTPNWSANDCTERYKYIFHPGSISELRTDLFRFMGQFVGIAIRSKITLDLALPSAIWKQIVKESLNEKDIASFDAPAYSFVQHLGSIISRLKSNNENLEALQSLKTEANVLLQDLNWTATRSDGEIIELIPDGQNKTVDLENLERYLHLYVETRLNESLIPIEAFREGLTSIIPAAAISLLSYDEFENVVCGNRIIDIQRLKENTEYDDDVSMDDEHIIYFWETLEEFTEEEKSLFLRFVWARPTLPPTGVEFPQKFKIQTAVGDEAQVKPDSYLPKAHTCFFSINLPKYTSKEMMTEKLRYAITNCTEMDADFRITDSDVTGWSLQSLLNQQQNMNEIDDN